MGPDRSASRIGDLICQSKTGDQQACNELLAMYRPYLRLVAGRRLPRVLHKRDDASDIVQHTMVDAARGLAGFHGQTEAEFTAWVLKLLDRNLLQSVRRHLAGKRDLRREIQFHASDGSAVLFWHQVEGSGSLPQSSVFRGEDALMLATALQRLPPAQRTAVELRYLEQMQLNEIAAEMEKSVGMVAGLIRRGVEALRKYLPDELG